MSGKATPPPLPAHRASIASFPSDLDYLAAFKPIGAREVISGLAPHVYDPTSPEGRRIARRLSRNKKRRNSCRSKRPCSMPTPRPSPLREYVISDDDDTSIKDYFGQWAKDDSAQTAADSIVDIMEPSEPQTPPGLEDLSLPGIIIFPPADEIIPLQRFSPQLKHVRTPSAEKRMSWWSWFSTAKSSLPFKLRS